MLNFLYLISTNRSRNSGGLLVFVRSSVPARMLSNYRLPPDIQAIPFEINLRKKWLSVSINHHPLTINIFVIPYLNFWTFTQVFMTVRNKPESSSSFDLNDEDNILLLISFLRYSHLNNIRRVLVQSWPEYMEQTLVLE